VRREVRVEPAAGLRELALAGEGAARHGRVVPGDGDVHEPLEEIPLTGGSGAPDVLERLVRGEVLAPLDQVEAVLVPGLERVVRARP